MYGLKIQAAASWAWARASTNASSYATLAELNVDTVPPTLSPIPGTPLGESALMTPHDALKSVALFRSCALTAHITIAGGRERVLGDYQPGRPWPGPTGS